MVEAEAELYRIKNELTAEEIESPFDEEEMPFETYSKKIIIEKDDGGRNYYYEGEDEAPEGLSYEEDGLVRTHLTVNEAAIHYGEAEVVGEGEESEVIVSINRTRAALPFLSEEDKGEKFILLHGDSFKDELERLTESTSISPELVGGHYYMEHDILTADEGHPEEKITVDGKEIQVRLGKMTTTASDKEEAQKLFSEVIERLKEDDNWPPELKWYRRVGQGNISVDESVEMDERKEEVLDEKTFYDIPLNGNRNVTFTEIEEDDLEVIVGQSKESHEDAKQALEDVKEVDGVEIELENEGGIRDSIKFHSYQSEEN